MSEKLRILAVEDNPTDILFIEGILPETGPVSLQVESVSRLSEALSRLKSKDIDLVLLDLGLPDSPGLQTFHKLRQAAPDLPVIVLTASDDQELAVAAVRDGAQDYFIKGEVGGSLLARAARYAVERQRAEAKLRESESRFRHIANITSDIAYSCSRDAAARYTFDWMAGAVERVTGYTVEEVAAHQCRRCLVVEQDRPLFDAQVTGLVPGASAGCEFRLRRKDGTIAWVNSFAKCTQDDDQLDRRRLYGGLADITERKANEAEIERMNCVYATSSQVNQAIVGCRSREEVFERICRVAVESGKFRAAWIGWRTAGTDQVTAVARDAGPPDPTLTLLGQNQGCGMTAEAVRTGRPCLSQDAQQDERTACCHAVFSQAGIRSCAGFPILFHGEVCGAFSICSVETRSSIPPRFVCWRKSRWTFPRRWRPSIRRPNASGRRRRCARAKNSTAGSRKTCPSTSPRICRMER